MEETQEKIVVEVYDGIVNSHSTDLIGRIKQTYASSSVAPIHSIKNEREIRTYLTREGVLIEVCFGKEYETIYDGEGRNVEFSGIRQTPIEIILASHSRDALKQVEQTFNIGDAMCRSITENSKENLARRVEYLKEKEQKP